MKLAVNGLRMFVKTFGDGLPVILVHGFPLDHTIWLPVVELLENEARLILPDLRGHGQSDAPAGTYSMRLIAQDLAALQDALAIRCAILVGHSMGGYASLAFAQEYPDRLAGLGMVASQAAADSEERRNARYQMAAEVAEKGVTPIAALMAERLFARKDLVPEIERVILNTSPVGVVGALKGLAERPDMSGFLEEINVPTAVIAGSQDGLVPGARTQELVEKIPQAKLTLIQAVGHMPMLEAPEETAGALLELISTVKRQL